MHGSGWTIDSMSQTWISYTEKYGQRRGIWRIETDLAATVEKITRNSTINSKTVRRMRPRYARCTTRLYAVMKSSLSSSWLRRTDITDLVRQEQLKSSRSSGWSTMLTMGEGLAALFRSSYCPYSWTGNYALSTQLKHCFRYETVPSEGVILLLNEGPFCYAALCTHGCATADGATCCQRDRSSSCGVGLSCKVFYALGLLRRNGYIADAISSIHLSRRRFGSY